MRCSARHGNCEICSSQNRIIKQRTCAGYDTYVYSMASDVRTSTTALRRYEMPRANEISAACTQTPCFAV